MPVSSQKSWKRGSHKGFKPNNTKTGRRQHYFKKKTEQLNIDVKIVVRRDDKSPAQTTISKFGVFQSDIMEILKQSKVKRCKTVWNVTKIISKKKISVLLMTFFFASSFIFFYCQNHLIVTSDVIICTGYTIFANTLNLWVYIFRNNSKNKFLVTVKELAVC